MLASKGRSMDMKDRANILECMEILLRVYQKTGDEKHLSKAKEFGQFAAYMADRIKNHDYTEEDKMWQRVAEIDRMWNSAQSRA